RRDLSAWEARHRDAGPIDAELGGPPLPGTMEIRRVALAADDTPFVRAAWRDVDLQRGHASRSEAADRGRPDPRRAIGPADLTADPDPRADGGCRGAARDENLDGRGPVLHDHPSIGRVEQGSRRG